MALSSNPNLPDRKQSMLKLFRTLYIFVIIERSRFFNKCVLFRELGALGQPNIPWPTTPVKTASAEVQVLIEEELPEDSSDEEYDPDQDLQSDDDDKEADNSIGSDVDSQPSTPATPLNDSFSQEAKIDTQYDSEGVFKIPEYV